MARDRAQSCYLAVCLRFLPVSRYRDRGRGLDRVLRNKHGFARSECGCDDARTFPCGSYCWSRCGRRSAAPHIRTSGSSRWIRNRGGGHRTAAVVSLGAGSRYQRTNHGAELCHLVSDHGRPAFAAVWSGGAERGLNHVFDCGHRARRAALAGRGDLAVGWEPPGGTRGAVHRDCNPLSNSPERVVETRRAASAPAVASPIAAETGPPRLFTWFWSAAGGVRTLFSRQLKCCVGSQLHAVASVVLGAVEGLIGGVDDLLGLTMMGARLGNSDADGYRQIIRRALENRCGFFSARLSAFRFARASFIPSLRAAEAEDRVLNRPTKRIKPFESVFR